MIAPHKPLVEMNDEFFLRVLKKRRAQVIGYEDSEDEHTTTTTGTMTINIKHQHRY